MLLTASSPVADDVVGDERNLQFRTMATIRAIAFGLEQYQLDYTGFPVLQKTTVDALQRPLAEYYDSFPDTRDAWGQPIHVVSSGLAYVIWSSGSDMLDEESPAGGPRDGSAADIVYYGDLDHPTGSFWQGPRGRCGVDTEPGPNPIQRIGRDAKAISNVFQLTHDSE